MKASLILAALLASAVLYGCATRHSGAPQPEGVSSTKDPADYAALQVVAFVTNPSNLQGLTPQTSQARLGSLVQLEETEKNETEWTFLGRPREQGTLYRARLTFTPGEAGDEIGSIVFTFANMAEGAREKFFSRLEQIVNEKLGQPRFAQPGEAGQDLMRGWALGTDWQVTLAMPEPRRASGVVVLSAGVQHEP